MMDATAAVVNSRNAGRRGYDHWAEADKAELVEVEQRETRQSNQH